MKKKAIAPNHIIINSQKGRRSALFAENDKLQRFLKTVEPTSPEYGRALARMNEINAQLYR